MESRSQLRRVRPREARTGSSAFAPTPGGGLRGRVRLLLFGLLLVAAFAFTTLLIVRYLNVEEVSLPDVVGMSVDDAFVTLRRLGLTVTSYPESVPGAQVDTVTSQNPPPGERVRAGRGVGIGVYAPPKDVRVPSLVGRRDAEVETLLGNVSLLLGGTSYAYSEQPQGTIIAQTPPAGETLTSGESVNIVESRGPALSTITLPDLRGMNVMEARERLKALGVRRVETLATDVSFNRPGTVSAQQPAAGESVPVSATVTLSYALSGREVVQVPQVEGNTLQRAQLVLQAAGLGVSGGGVTYVNDPARPSGVVEVTPSGYTLRGSPVRLVVNGAATGENAALTDGAGFQTEFQVTPGDQNLNTGTSTGFSSNPDAAEGDESAWSVPITFDPTTSGITRGEGAYEFRLIVNDAQGERTVIDRAYAASESVSTRVTVYGKATLQIYINNELYLGWSP